MTSKYQRIRVLTVALVSAAFIGCGDEDKEQEDVQKTPPPPSASAPDSADLAKTRGFFNPKKDEAWTYRVTREVPVTSHLSDHDALRVVTKHEHHYELIFERKRVCGGLVKVEGSEIELVLIDIYEDGILAEQEYYEINDEGLFGRGWSGHPGQAPTISKSAIPIAIPGMTGGMMWRTSAEKTAKQYKFRVIDRTSLELPAGTFDVAQVQIISGDTSNSLKRTLWFAENVGIVKEITTYYDATSIRIRESSELVKWHLPNAVQAEEKPEDPFAAQATSTGPTPPEETEDEL